MLELSIRQLRSYRVEFQTSAAALGGMCSWQALQTTLARVCTLAVDRGPLPISTVGERAAECLAQ